MRKESNNVVIRADMGTAGSKAIIAQSGEHQSAPQLNGPAAPGGSPCDFLDAGAAIVQAASCRNGADRSLRSGTAVSLCT